jgi:hypothetical protein
MMSHNALTNLYELKYIRSFIMALLIQPCNEGRHSRTVDICLSFFSDVILDGWVTIVSSLVHKDVLVRTVLYSVTVIYMEHVTLWVVYASVTQDGSYVSAL